MSGSPGTPATLAAFGPLAVHLALSHSTSSGLMSSSIGPLMTWPAVRPAFTRRPSVEQCFNEALSYSITATQWWRWEGLVMACVCVGWVLKWGLIRDSHPLSHHFHWGGNTSHRCTGRSCSPPLRATTRLGSGRRN